MKRLMLLLMFLPQCKTEEVQLAVVTKIHCHTTGWEVWLGAPYCELPDFGFEEMMLRRGVYAYVDREPLGKECRIYPAEIAEVVMRESDVQDAD